MTRRSAVALVAYFALVATLFTPLYDPLTSGDDDSWAIGVLLVSVHLAVGAAIARTWVLAVPVVAAAAAFVVAGAGDLAWLIPILALPIAVVLTAAGWGAAWLLRTHAIAAAVVLFVLAAAPAAWAGVATIDRETAPRVPADVQAQLPLEVSLGNLCEGASSPPRVVRDVRHRGEVLLRELRENPDSIVTKTDYLAHEGKEEKRDITVRELAEEELDDLQFPECRIELRRRLEAGLAE